MRCAVARTIWNTPALDPELGLVYFAVGNCGPDYDGSMREGDNLFCASIVALKAKTGEYAWHFQQVHHDIWDYDAASPVVLFDTVINGQPRKGIAEAGRTGWVYILDRTNGKPLIGIEEKPVPQEPRQKTAKTQPYPGRRRDRAAMRRADCRATTRPAASSTPFWEAPVLIQPSGIGGTNWSPMPYSPDTGYFYVPGTVRTSAFARYGNKYKHWAALHRRHTGGADRLDHERHVHRDRRQDQQDRLAAQDAVPRRRRRRLDRYGGRAGACAASRTAISSRSMPRPARSCSGSRPDLARTLRRWSTRWMASSTSRSRPAAIRCRGSAYGDAVWTFSLKGQLGPLWPPPAPPTVAGPIGPIAAGADAIKIGANNIEYSFSPARTRIKSGDRR